MRGALALRGTSYPLLNLNLSLSMIETYSIHEFRKIFAEVCEFSAILKMKQNFSSIIST